MNSETSLWAAVIDATSFRIQGEHPRSHERLKAEARVWLTISNPDFTAACIRAGFDERAV